MSISVTYLSLNEINFYFTRAAVGAGAPFGIGEEFSEASKCLSYLGIDPARVAISALSGLVSGKSTKGIALGKTDHVTNIRSGNGRIISALFAGPVVADRLSIAAISSREQRIRLDDTDQPLLVVGAIIAADIGASQIEVAWQSKLGDRVAFKMHGGAVEITGFCTRTLDAPAPTPVRIILNCERNSRPNSGLETLLLAQGRSRSVEHGVAVDNASWLELYGFFRESLVPASAESRRSGAGAGQLTDND